jgi:hypothetical protein
MKFASASERVKRRIKARDLTIIISQHAVNFKLFKIRDHRWGDKIATVDDYVDTLGLKSICCLIHGRNVVVGIRDDPNLHE